jgi:hypothetical protein
LARWSRARRARGVALAVLGVLLPAAAVRGQEAASLLERLGLDRLQFESLGAAVGRVDPTQVEAAQIWVITADYGEVARNWRVVFDVSYWESRLSDRTVQSFIDSLRKSIVDPTGDYSITRSRVPMYDVAFSGSVRWQSASPVAFRPYGSFGLAAHVINAEGRLIKGTFVERALDNIATGLFVNAGVLFRPWGRVVGDAQARADLLSGYRSLQLRAGAHYLFGPLRRPDR